MAVRHRTYSGGKPIGPITPIFDVDKSMGSVLVGNTPSSTVPSLLCDYFERDDGPIGDDWISGPVTGSNEEPELLTISGGAAIGPFYQTGVSDAVGSMIWATPIVAASQYIEVIFENWYLAATTSEMSIEIFNLSGVDSYVDDWDIPPRRAARFEMSNPLGVPRVRIQSGAYTDDGDTPPETTTTHSPYSGGTGPQTLRLESYADGRQVVSLNGVVVQDYVSSRPTTNMGYQQGVYMTWLPYGGRTAPRILSICGGSL